jgi:hypothetical protein
MSLERTSDLTLGPLLVSPAVEISPVSEAAQAIDHNEHEPVAREWSGHLLLPFIAVGSRPSRGNIAGLVEDALDPFSVRRVLDVKEETTMILVQFDGSDGIVPSVTPELRAIHDNTKLSFRREHDCPLSGRLFQYVACATTGGSNVA